ncbi:ATP-dependent exonuclase V beta subunit, helicase and exonuclease domain-containing [Marinitoga piezophila KA3]|uniref:DNA 3'-5' helicase n=1 Tax=Marinitoga piezophila (strain DSM 14283 / JCM 11233 / KA3) TaxID=443254 RepID=H2J3I2_MARPK|nr:UvrD-helicase domain-containing protein [Marinitoga piezophila]AEX84626.1 ATP-dependent exonuclase V beta subunit, helicase and exonuclease domain-containing [Marinitoga piezophila KA3]
MPEVLNIEEMKKNLDKNYFISASAGTGKTYTITQYYVAILEKYEKENNPDIVQNILAVTFTNKAAGEMKERILEEIDKKLDKGKNYKYWRQIKTNLNSAWIMTIDSFCSRILRENNIAIGVDPNFTIINELRMGIEIEKSVYNTLKIIFSIYEDIMEDKESNIEEITFFLSPERRETVKKIINELIQNKENFIIALKFILQELKIDTFKEVLLDTLRNWRTEMKMSQIPEYDLPNPDYNKVLWLFKNAVLIAQEIYNLYTEDQFQFDFKGVLAKTLETLEDENIKEKYQHKFKYIIVDEYQDTNFLQKALFDKIHTDENYIFYVGDRKQSIYRFRGADVSVFAVTENEFEEDSKFQLRVNRRSNAEIVEFANEFSEKMLFNDELLGVYENVKKTYEKIYKNLLFSEDKDYSEYEVKDENDVIPSISKDGTDKRRIKYVTYIKPKKNDKKSDEEKNIEYETIARTIQSLIGKKMKFRKRENGKIIFEEREIKYSDIAVLLRELKISEDKIRKSFKKYNIPFYILGSKSFYDKNEIQTIFSALNAVQNPRNDFNFSAYMMSLIGGMTFERLNEFIEIKKGNKEKYSSLYEVVSNNKDKLSPEELKAFEVLERYVKLKYYLKPTHILKQFISETNYLSKLTLMSDAHYAIANVKKLINEAEQYNTLAVSFAELIKLLKKTSEVSESEAAIEDEKQNVVKVLTIHKSKGLEFPIVILGGLGKELNLNSEEETGENVSLSKEETEFSLPEDNVRYFILKKLFLKTVKNIELPLTDKEKINVELGEGFSKKFDINKFLEDTEVLRLMYVAITRPKEMLIPIIPIVQENKTKKKKDENDDGKYKYVADLFMHFQYEDKRDIIALEELENNEISVNEEVSEKSRDIKEKQLSDLTGFAYKKYIAPTYIINELKKEETTDDLTEEGYIKITADDFFSDEESILKGTELHNLMESVGNFSQILNLIETGELPEELNNALIERLFSAKRFKTEWRLVKRLLIDNKEYMIFGVPDRVIFDEENNIEILDYKYSELNNSEKIEDYKFQLQFYMYLLKDFGNPLKGYIISLKNGKIIEVEYNKNFEEELKKKISML